MGYQKCPVCNGTGKYTPPVGTIGDVGGRCHVCKGYGIINEATGEPPKKTFHTFTITSTVDEALKDSFIEQIKERERRRKIFKFFENRKTWPSQNFYLTCDPEGGQCVPAKGIDELS